MKAATKRILCYILLCLFVLTTITASLTFGRYTSEKASDNDYKGDIEYILGDAIIINTIDDFFQAIENGYSNIQLGEELDNPLIISGGMSGVVSDLIIDLNGHEIQRNNREPILDVKDGINLTIIDTSADKTGSLYNPVGSVLKVSGGTLTAAAGIFESGPRSGKRDNKGGRVETGSKYDEYAVAKDNTWSAPSGGEFTQADEFTQNDIKEVQLFERPESGSGEYVKVEGTALLPIIKPKDAEATGTNLAVNGNMYFDENSKVGYPVDGTKIITKDTYLYYTFESENMQFTDTAASGSAEYYYQYYVVGDESNGTVNFDYATNQKKKDENDESDTRVPVTVYVYNNVKGSADKNNSYAAINMASGNLYARAGYYYSYFGKEDTYCVDATGGYMAVTQGQFNAFGNGVGIQCAYGESAEANEYLNITQGTFYSQNGDTIRVSGGMLEVGTAKIEKDATDSADKWFANGSAIAVYGGDITVNNSLKISVKGSGCAGIRSDGAGAVTANKNCTITLTGDQNVGIYSGGTDGTPQPVIIGSQSSGEVTANITLNGKYSYGIYSAGGNVNIAGGGGTVAFDIKSQNSENNYSRAIYAKDGGNINIGTSGETYATFNLDGAHVQGINVDGGNVNICTANNAASTATFNLGQNASITSSNISGILTSSDSGVKSAVVIGSTSSTFTLEATGTAMSGIYARGGSISLLGEVDFTLDSRGSAEGAGIAGIYSEGGAVEIGAEGTQNTAAFSLSGGYLRGISVSGEASSATFNGATTVNMTDGINNSYGIAASQGTLTFNNSVNIAAQGASDTVYGIYTSAGTIDIGSAATITFAENYTSNSATNYTSNSAYGIYATGADSVVDIGGETTILYNGAATYSDGIYNSGGNVAISSNTTIEFKNTQSNCNGIHSVSGDIDFGIASQSAANQNVVVTINLDSAYNSNGLYIENGTIDIGGLTYSSEINSQYTNSLSNTAIYAKAGTVNFATTGTAEGQGVNIVSDNLGIVSGANLNFESGNVDITTPNGTAIYVYNGSLIAAESVNVDITSGINGNGWGVEGTESQTNIYNGVFVNGGSLISNGTLNVTHTGVANDNVGSGDNAGNTPGYEYRHPGYEYRDFAIKSFAVRVEGAAGTEVQLNFGTIKNTVGGGLYVSGGTVTLGNEDSRQNDISITTEGTSYSSEKYTVYGHSGNWQAPVPIKGGHAVQVNGGSLTIYNGTYQSALGNGILVSNGTATIHDGKFDGTDYTDTIGGVAGAAANYGFKMYGGTVFINGGTFSEGKNGSGAFVMGTDSVTAKANIYGGSFDVTGQAGFSVYQYAEVTFGEEGDPNNKITVKGLAAGLTIETTPNGGAPTVTINAGEFSSKSKVNDGSGVWYGNGGATLKITGGQFTGTSKSGLWIDKDPGTNIQLSGGTYKGERADRAYGYDWGIQRYPYYVNGGAIGANASRGGGAGGPSSGAVVYKKDFIVAGCTVYGENGWTSGESAYITNDNDTIHENIMGYRKITISRQA